MSMVTTPTYSGAFTHLSPTQCAMAILDMPYVHIGHVMHALESPMSHVPCPLPMPRILLSHITCAMCP